MANTSFSAFSSNRATLANLSANIEAVTRQARVIADSVTEIGRNMTPAAAPSMRELLDSVGLRGLPLPSLANARTCSLPACECPSPDLGEVRRVAERADDLNFSVRFRNTTGKARDFAFDGGELHAEDGKGGGTLTLSAKTASLESGAATVMQVAVEGREFRTGVDYCGQIRIRAKECETMYLGVCMRIQHVVERVPTIDLHCCCESKSRPLRWYHHYYCDPPAQPEPKPRPEG
ncbi:hypothetical protein [Allopontixanthobacter sediminis]|uniref:Uncharacterized protein n=1 Tax=Allopontixanthobacter sediminis TaxID=1689985 RepID=A0A845AUX6_9SPHN|nr:hypothetical protein [Allopontixanthobacter sediminis]MXP42841.1 hypothetical protein [Allopontixanthobacter sediminis]